MSAKASRRLRTALVVVLVLAALYATYRYTLYRMVESKLDEIRRQGYPVTVAELDKWYPQPPRGENAADVYTQAFQHFVELKSDTNLPVVGYAKLPKRGDPTSDEMRRAIADYLERNAQALSLLHSAEKMRRGRYNTDPLSVNAALFSEMRQAVRLLQLEAIFHAESLEPVQATDSIMSAIGVAESLANEPGTIALLVRRGCIGMAFWGLERSLNWDSLTSAQVEQLATRFSEAEDLEAASRALAVEWASTENLFSASIGDRFIALTSFPPSADRVRLDKLLLYEYGGWKELDHLRALEVIRTYVAAAKLPLPERLDAANTLNARAEHFPDLFLRSRQIGSILPSVVVHDAECIAYVRLSLAALAVEKYRIATGLLPEKIPDLKSSEIHVELDPFDGQPLRYKKLTKGYVVYSVGGDRKDDGGAEPGPCFGPGTDITFTVER
jgi:hypothetical protein